MNWKYITQSVLIVSALLYFWVGSFYFVLEKRAEAACIAVGFTDARLAGLVVYCERIFEGTSYLIPLTDVHRLKLKGNGL